MPEQIMCIRCLGYGWHRRPSRTNPDGEKIECEACSGTGRVDSPPDHVIDAMRAAVDAFSNEDEDEEADHAP